MGLESLFGLMEESMKAAGCLANKMEEALILHLLEKVKKENGRMGKESHRFLFK